MDKKGKLQEQDETATKRHAFAKWEANRFAQVLMTVVYIFGTCKE